tara:strand:+ start:707 stop:1069 length:363 start_codon:yes stop_codon:yes gene_type:complete
MGNSTSEEKTLLNDNTCDTVLYECVGTIYSTNYSKIEINDIFIIQLLENELILKNDKTVYRFIYQNISSWVCSKKNTLFGFYFNIQKKTYELFINVDNATEISNNLHTIIHKLIHFYKDL